MVEKVVRKKVAKTTTRKTATRKAPSRASSASRAQDSNNVPLIICGVFVVVIGISVVIGFLDKGQINIQGTINNTKEHGTEEEKQKIENLPVQRTNKVRNNGLVPSSGADREKALEALEKQTGETASTSASSTDSTASSTEESLEEEEVTEQNEESPEETIEEGA